MEGATRFKNARQLLEHELSGQRASNWTLGVVGRQETPKERAIDHE